MILIPIGQEQNTVRRLPWVTITMMIACGIAFVLTGFGAPGLDEETEQAFNDAVEYYFQHPDLDLPPEMERMVFQGVSEQEREALRESLKSMAGFASDEEEVGKEILQERLDALCETALGGLENHAFQRYGLVPNNMSPLAMLTHMFLHGGWGHLLGNMLILFLAAPFVEDVWGRPLFAGFYIFSGFAAAMAFVVANPDSSIPMVGASGAIAGVMGAFLVRFHSNRIRFFYMVGLFWRGTFFAPAWLMLPLWFGEQVFMMMMVEGLDLPDGGGIAYWAHIGGFAFGAVVAIVVRKARIEERFISKGIEDKITLVANPVIEEAAEARSQGRPDQAFTLLAEAWKKDPDNEDIALSLWDIAVEQGWGSHAAPAMVRLVESDLRAGRSEEAIERWYELLGRAPQAAVAPALCLRFAQLFGERGQADWSLDALRRARAAGPALPTPLLLRTATLAAPLDPALAADAAREVLTRPDLMPEDRARAEALIGAPAHI